MNRPFLVFIFAVGIAALPTSRAVADDVNSVCPVIQDRPASAEHSVIYKGREVRFCCSECVIEFNRNPEIYENVLPQLQNLSLRARLQIFMGDHGGVLLGSILLTVLIGLRVYRLKHPVTGEGGTSGTSGLLHQQVSPAVPLLILCGYLGYEVYSLHSQLHETQLEDEIHFATFYDFGYPPVPRRPNMEPSLSGTYYRGNDERSPKLFNNGNYRTATFEISLCDQGGNAINPGDDISNRDVFLRFDIDRPPFTPDFLYDQQMMQTMFLTAECDRFLGRDEEVADAVGLTETVEMQHWQALYPLRRADSCCCGDECRGTVYVCEKYFYQPQIQFLARRRGGSRFHYGIRYDLRIDDGVLADSSEIYMGALYRTRKLPTWKVPMTEWFSHTEIPVLPSENVNDPELLGLPEHLAKQQ